MLPRERALLSAERDRNSNTGTLVLVVGPSGVGKDTLIDAARERYAGDVRFAFPLRIITRPEGPSERHVPVSPDRFEADEAAGCYLLTWRSHGLAYAIPAGVRDELAQGRIAVCNVSRTVIARAEELVGDIVVVHVTASADARARRIRSRGREGEGETASRLARQLSVATTCSPVVEIENDGELADAVGRFVGALGEIASARRGMQPQ